MTVHSCAYLNTYAAYALSFVLRSSLWLFSLTLYSHSQSKGCYKENIHIYLDIHIYSCTQTTLKQKAIKFTEQYCKL